MFCLRGGAPCRQVVAVHLFGPLAVNRPVQSVLVVERQVAPQSQTGCADVVVAPLMHLLVLHAPPQRFHKHVVPPAACAVHTDPDTMVFQTRGELLVGELAALVDVEDVRSAIAG